VGVGVGVGVGVCEYLCLSWGGGICVWHLHPFLTVASKVNCGCYYS